MTHPSLSHPVPPCSIELTPISGWSAFTSKNELLDLIWDSLKLREHGGCWAYHNFTSHDSFWAAEDCSRGSELHIEFEGDADSSGIRRLVVSLSEVNSVSFFQLSTLRNTMLARYSFAEAVFSPD